ncbi:MAG: hypothetical protein IJG55_10625, partial [Synergistaceae bacterium]|nr:hypothetical protein [Synergistaceae bacterium]
MAKTFKRVRRIILLLVVLLSLNQNHNSYAAVYENYYVEESSESINEENLPPATEPDTVTLNADRVSFNDETGYATAQGNAILKYKDTTIEAERIEYNADTQKVQAMPLP